MAWKFNICKADKDISTLSRSCYTESAIRQNIYQFHYEENSGAIRHEVTKYYF